MAIVTNFSTSSSVKCSLDYGSNPSKVGASISMNCSSNYADAVRDFSMPFQMYGREKDKVKVHRFVLSFANDNSIKSELNDDDAKDYVYDFMDDLDKQLGGRYPIIAFQHLNTSYNHYHFYIGACGTDGTKFHPKSSPLYMCRNVNDTLSQKYHLRPIKSYKRDYRYQYSYGNKQSFQRKHSSMPYSYKNHARQMIARAILSSSNLKDFEKSMIEQDGGIDRSFYRNDTKTGCVYIPFMHKDRLSKSGDPKFRKVRTRSLGRDFEKDKVKEAIYSNDKGILNHYRYYAQDSKMVQGGKKRFPAILTPSMTMSHTASKNMHEVPYKDNTVRKLFNLKGYKDRGMLGSGLSMAALKGLKSEEKKELMKDYRFGKDLFGFLSSVFSVPGSIFSDFKKSFNSGNEITRSRIVHLERVGRSNPRPFAKFKNMSVSDVNRYIGKEADRTPDRKFVNKKMQGKKFQQYKKKRINNILENQRGNKINRKNKLNPHFHI